MTTPPAPMIGSPMGHSSQSIATKASREPSGDHAGEWSKTFLRKGVIAREPLASSGEDTWAPFGAAWFESALHVATLRGERLLRVSPEGRVETARDGLGRLRVATVGPDGCLYVGTSNRDGRGSPREGDDRLLRICER